MKINYLLFLFFFLFVCNDIVAQEAETPKPNWKIKKIKKSDNHFEFWIKTKIPKGWMIATEKKPNNIIPLEIYFENKDMVKLEFIKQIKGEKIYPEELAEIFEMKIETTARKIEFLVKAS